MDNRYSILECALRLFAARGYDAVGVQEIVDEAGITKPTMYHYFGSKRGLLEALLEQEFGAFNRLLLPAADYHGDLPGTLRTIAFAFSTLRAPTRLFTACSSRYGLRRLRVKVTNRY